MAFFDLPLADLRNYQPDVVEPEDFDDFWASTLTEAGGGDLNIQLTDAPTSLRHVHIQDATFAGYGGDPIKAWYSRPAGITDDLPLIVQFIGYSGGRGQPHEHTLFPSAGYAHLVVDTRGQGYSFAHGDTPDPAGTDPSVPGFMTRGVMNKEDYYYRRVFTDAVRAVQAGRQLPGVDGERVVVFGGSQGGGIALAAAALDRGVAGAIAHVPFLQHMKRAVSISDAAPYSEITRYLSVFRDRAETAWNTISYFDGVNLAKRATAPVLYSVALMDNVCPPSTVFASFNAYGTASGAAPPKDIEVWEYNKHEGGGAFQREVDLRWLAQLLGN